MRPFSLTLLALAARSPAPPRPARSRRSELKSVLAREMRAAPATSGAYVRDLDSGAVLFAKRESTRRIPASVEKLFTTSSALLRMGPTATLQTLAVTAPDAVVDAGWRPARRPRARRRRRSVLRRRDRQAPRTGRPRGGDPAASTAPSSATRAQFDARRSVCCTGYDPDLGGVLSALAYDRGIFRGRPQLERRALRGRPVRRRAEGRRA